MRRHDLTTRCVHEASLHQDNCFPTLTYAPEHLPADLSVHIEHVQKFINHLRKTQERAGNPSFRYLAAGEYGQDGNTINSFTGRPDIGRPHYHLLLFGFRPNDLKPWRQNDRGDILYRSELLERHWPQGHVEIGEVTKASAGYCTSYVFKKQTGEKYDGKYTIIHPETGETILREREFATWSNRPAIGRGWFDQYIGDTEKGYLSDGTGKIGRVPKYYQRRFKQLAAQDADLYFKYEQLQERKKESIDPDHPDNKPERLKAIEECQKERIKRGSKYSL